MQNAILELKEIKKSFGNSHILNGITLDVAPGEFITLLGSSGCGKTTILRIIAGLETCDSGSVLLEGKDVTFEPPEHRDLNMVFQSYALFPHMSVGENIGYGLKLKGISKKDRRPAVEEALRLVQLPGYADRNPSELSGGQRQRVAIARAIINHPKVLLLDEPLGALDLKLRKQMQLELKRLQKQLGITFIYITHDQEEALNMSDRIAVMKNGVFQQLDTPSVIYDHPKNAYVASFVGSANLLSGTAVYRDGSLFLRYGTVEVPVSEGSFIPKEGDSVLAAIRSEYIDLLPDNQDGIHAIVREKAFSAGMLRIALETELGEEVIASRHGIDSSLTAGDSVRFSFSREHAVLVEASDVS